jgi:hypothetical protein
VVQGPPPVASATDTLLPPEAAGARAVVRTVWPPLLATLGVAPLLAGRPASGSHAPAGVIGAVTIPVYVLLGLVGVWVRRREPIHAWFRDAFSQVGAGSGPAAAG